MLVYGKCECFVMHMLYVCVLCASCGSSQYCVLHDLQFFNAGRGCKRQPRGRGILQRRSHNCFVGSYECLRLFTRQQRLLFPFFTATSVQRESTILHCELDEYSHLLNHSTSSEWSECGNDFLDERLYSTAVHAVETAIENEVMSSRLAQGSSGSYFARYLQQNIVGLFKQKDEEPYGHLILDG